MNKPSKPASVKSTKPTEKSSSLSTRVRQRGISVVELLFAAATLGSAVLVAAMNSTKKPPIQGD